MHSRADHLGTPAVITDSSNTDVWRWVSDPFGGVAANEDPDGDGQVFNYNLRFPGQYYDEETSKHYNVFRDYDPATGRYIKSDPIGINGGLNTYSYVFSSPINYIDSLGLAGSRSGGRRALPPTYPEIIAELRVPNLIEQIRRYDPSYNYAIASRPGYRYNRTDIEWLERTLRRYQSALSCPSESATLPEEIYSSKAPFQVSPGVRSLEGQYINNQGRVEPWEAFYDQYGRIKGRSDYNAGNRAQDIPTTHYHTYEWGLGMSPMETGSHLPGEYGP